MGVWACRAPVRTRLFFRFPILRAFRRVGVLLRNFDNHPESSRDLVGFALRPQLPTPISRKCSIISKFFTPTTFEIPLGSWSYEIGIFMMNKRQFGEVGTVGARRATSRPDDPTRIVILRADSARRTSLR